MNFYNEDEKKDGAPALPGASSFKKTSAFGKAPLFSRATGGIMDRIKNLSRKDMAFVGIGLSVLVMAPVAEYMMSKPSADNMLTPGFGSRDGSAASGLYEPGINALSQGSPDGSGEVITPLSSRDPASLILGPQSAAPAYTPPAAPPTNSFRDAMKDVGRNAFSEATKAAGAPTPIPRMQSALRNFGSFFSGGEGTRTVGSLGGGKIIDDAKSASSKSAKRSMLGPVAMAGYKGVASNTPNSSSKGAYEKLRSAADKSAGNFTGGSAISSLDKAAADALDIGKGTGGMGSGGDSDKTTKPSGSTTKYDHNRSGESLAEKAAAARQQKELEWEFYKKYEIPKKIIEAILTGITGPLTDMVQGNMENIFGLSSQPSYCWQPAVCPSGDCDEMIKKYKVVAAVDLCYNPGAQKFSWEAAGKDKSSGGQVNCICGKANKPLGKVYETGGVPPADPVAPAVPGAPIVPGTGNPQQISADAVKIFETYDAALSNVVGTVIKTETLLTEKKTEAELKTQFAALGGAFDELGNAANGPAKNALSNLSATARKALNTYAGQITTAQEELNKGETAYKKYDAAIKKIQADIAAGKLQTNAADGKKADETAGTETITQVIAAHEPHIGGNIINASKLLAVHSVRLNAYNQQLTVIDASIGTIMTAHASVAPEAKKFLAEAAGDTFPAKLSQATGRDPVAVVPSAPAAPAPGPVAKDVGESVGSFVKDNVNQAVGEQPAPFKTAVEKLRAADWKKIWPPDSKFDSTKAAKAEVDAWNAFDSGVSGGKLGSIVSPDNFVANAARSGAIHGGAVGSAKDFPNISGFINTATVNITQAKKALENLVKPCYFGDGGCSGTQTPVEPPVVTPPVVTPPVVTPPVVTPPVVTPPVAANTDALKGRLNGLMGDYDSAITATDKIQSRDKVAVGFRTAYDTKVAAYKASPEYTALRKDKERLGALKTELAGTVTAERAKAIEGEVGRIQGRLASNKSKALNGLAGLDQFVAEHPYRKPSTTPPAASTKLEAYPDAADAVKKAGDARMIWMNAKKSSDGALDHWRNEEDKYNALLKLGKDDAFYGIKHPAYTGQLLSQQKRMKDARKSYNDLAPATERARQSYDNTFASAKTLLEKYKLPLTYLPR